MPNVHFMRNCIFIFATIFLFSCKKSLEEIYEPPIISNEAIVKKFLEAPENISPLAQGILNDFKKREAQQPFIAEFAKRNGFPRWEFVEGTNAKHYINVETTDKAVNNTTNSTSSSSTTASMALLPLLDTLTNEVKAYTFCTKVHNSVYAYNTYNKKEILQQTAGSLQIQAQYKLTLGVNAYFEKKINNKLISIYNGTAGIFNYTNASIKISNTPISHISTSGSIAKEQFNNSNVVNSFATTRACYMFVGAVELTIDNEVQIFEIYVRVSCPTLPEVVVYSTPSSGGGGGGGGSSGFTGTLPGSGISLFSGWSFNSGSIGSGGTYQGEANYLPGHGPFYQDPNMPLLGMPQSYFSILDLYPELSAIANTANYNSVIAFAYIYKALQHDYNLRAGDPYAAMSREDFLEMLRLNPALATTIDPVTILAKVGAGVAADILMQVMFIKIMDDNVNTWSEAFGKIDWGQVAATALTSLFSWNTTTGKLLTAIVNGAAAVVTDLNNNGFQSWEITGRRFVEGFLGSVVGDVLGEVVTKFGGVVNFLKRIVNKLDEHFSYVTILRWLGGSLGIANPLREAYYGFTDFIVQNGVHVNFSINNVRKVIGWANDPSKVVLIGRNMDIIKKVKSNYHPDAKIFEGHDWISKKAQDDWDDLKKIYSGGIIPYDVVKTTLLYKENKAFIQKMKEEGYTFIDLGNPIGADPSAFYDMEKLLIFGD